MVQKVLRRSVVERVAGKTRSSIYAGMAAGAFPKPIKLGSKAVGWLESEIEAWIAERIAERDERERLGSSSEDIQGIDSERALTATRPADDDCNPSGAPVRPANRKAPSRLRRRL